MCTSPTREIQIVARILCPPRQTPSTVGFRLQSQSQNLSTEIGNAELIFQVPLLILNLDGLPRGNLRKTTSRTAGWYPKSVVESPLLSRKSRGALLNITGYCLTPFEQKAAATDAVKSEQWSLLERRPEHRVKVHSAKA